jgi:hypothetical protein
MKTAFFLFLFTLPLWAQSNALQLCDQQTPRHCVTVKAPPTLPANITCTLGSIGFAECSPVTNGFIVTGKSTVNGGFPPSTTSGLQFWEDASGSPDASWIYSKGHQLRIYGSPGVQIGGSSNPWGPPNSTDPYIGLFAGTSELYVGNRVRAHGGYFVDATNTYAVGDATNAFAEVWTNAVKTNGTTIDILGGLLPHATNTYSLGGTSNRWSKLWAQDADLGGTTTFPITGSTQCLQVNTSGVLSGTGAGCFPGVSNGFVVTGKSAVNGGSPPTTTAGLNVWFDSGISSLYSIAGSGNLGQFTEYASEINLYSKDTLTGGIKASMVLGTGGLSTIGDVYPLFNNQDHLGGASNRWSKLWVTNIDASGTVSAPSLTLAPATLPTPANGMLAIDASNVLQQYYASAWHPVTGTSGITALTGDVTATGPGSAAASVVKVNGAALPTSGVLKANVSGQIVQAGASDLPVMIASGATHSGGAVPDPGVTAGSSKFLREDATFAVPPVAGQASYSVGLTSPYYSDYNNIGRNGSLWVVIASVDLNAAFGVSGFDAGNDGDMLYVFNATPYAMKLRHDSSLSSSNLKLWIPGAADMTLAARQSVAFFRYGPAGGGTRWIYMGSY